MNDKTGQKPSGEKLKNKTSTNEAIRKKFRHGKVDPSLLKEELQKLKKLEKQGRRKIATQRAVSGSIHQRVSNKGDENVGTESMNRGVQTGEEAIYTAKKKHYSNKLHKRTVEERKTKENATTSNPTSRALQKKRIRKQMHTTEKEKQVKENAKRVGSLSQKAVEKVEKMASKLLKLVAEHPMELLIIGAVILVILLIVCGVSSCSMMGGGVQNVAISSSFTGEDDEIFAVEAEYTRLESELHNTMDNVEDDYPGYDEYRYTTAEIGHNPFQLAALLTVLYEDYTKSQVQSMLQTIFDAQYTFTTEEIVETRTRMETRTAYREVVNPDGRITWEAYTYEVEVEYEYKILQVTLSNHSLESVMSHLGLTEEQLQRYALLLQTMGNKPDIFGEDIYSNNAPGEYQDYDIPPEALTDQKFAKMIQEAEKYLGYPYVWGGASPSTSFDCSGFVSYVINHCGNGWSLGRLTANGLLNHCTRVSSAEAKPGDLIFFQGTYNTSGASHVGIYVGNGMMIHCGNPIQYASINTAYWQNHFLCFGRIN